MAEGGSVTIEAARLLDRQALVLLSLGAGLLLVAVFLMGVVAAAWWDRRRR